ITIIRMPARLTATTDRNGSTAGSLSAQAHGSVDSVDAISEAASEEDLTIAATFVVQPAATFVVQPAATSVVQPAATSAAQPAATSAAQPVAVSAAQPAEVSE